jgi:murein DD-endopeptidase MepM/ murein hydrolase activator NlpD
LVIVHCSFLAACSLRGSLAAAPAATPASKAFASAVAGQLTSTASRVTALGPGTATPTLTLTLTPPASPTPLPVQDPADPTAPVEPYENLSLDHYLLVGRPVPPHASVSVVASYRYGSTNQGRYDTHHGVEFANPANTQLIAAAPGRVLWAGDDQGAAYGPFRNFYGYLVVLTLDQKWQGHWVYVLYGHMLAVDVQPGQPVQTGDVLGWVGQSGVALGPHLHLEVRLDNPTDYYSTRNPELWLAPLPGTGTLAGQVLDSRGQPIRDARVDIECADGKFRFADTYHDATVTPDDGYQENFAMGDVPAGWCELSVDFLEGTTKKQVIVNDGATTFVVLEPE